MSQTARGFSHYRELILAIVFLVIASQEVLEMWLLEPRASLRGGPWPLSVEVILHLFQVVAVIAGTYFFFRAWQQRTALMDREVARSRQLGELVTALREKEDALAQAIEKLVFAQEQERRMIAYDMHDGLAQLVVSAKQHLDTCEDLWKTDPERAAGELARGLDRMSRAVEEVRRLLTALRPSLVDPIGLVHAVRASLDEVAREAGLAVTLTENLENARLPAVVETSAFRIVQEAVANALKHSRTRRVDVGLRRDGNALSITVVDHGVGFAGTPGETPGRGLGLLGMRERARLLGGECAIESAPDRGTCVRVRLPLVSGTPDGRPPSETSPQDSTAAAKPPLEHAPGLDGSRNPE